MTNQENNVAAIAQKIFLEHDRNVDLYGPRKVAHLPRRNGAPWLLQYFAADPATKIVENIRVRLHVPNGKSEQFDVFPDRIVYTNLDHAKDVGDGIVMSADDEFELGDPEIAEGVYNVIKLAHAQIRLIHAFRLPPN